MQSLTDIRRRIDAETLTAEAAIRDAGAAIVARDGALKTFVRITADARPGLPGPLQGIAVGIKDIIDTADFPTEYGSSIYAGWRPKADAAIVAVLKRLGATIIGKTVTTPFAFSDPAAAGTCNPHHSGHTPGGSSSGSAAAVAAGLVSLAFGTQTVGSVIRPASFCGVAAIKPSYRLLPMVGVKLLAPSLDTLGLFAAGVEDLAFALAAITGRSELRDFDTSPPRIGVVRQDFAGPPEDAAERALTRAIHAAERAGAPVRAISLPAIVAEANRLAPLVQSYEVWRTLAWEYDHHRDALRPNLAADRASAAKITAAAYDESQQAGLRAREAVTAAFTDVDVMLTFSAPGAAPAGLGSTGDPRYNRIWTLLGVPCVNVPALRENGLPIGVQVIARFGDDRRALSAARFLENALAWA